MSASGPDEPEETLPLTHRRYGAPEPDAVAEEPPSTPYAFPLTTQTSFPDATPGALGYAQPYFQPQKSHGGATIAMVLGIISVAGGVLTPVLGFTIVGVITAPFALVLGIVSLREMNRHPGVYDNKWAAITGLVTGVIGCVIGLVVLAVLVLFIWILGLFTIN